MKDKNSLKYKWVAAIPFICLIVYFLLAFYLDKYTKNSHPYLTSMVVFLVIPFEYYIVGLKKIRFIYPIFIAVLYLGVCGLFQGIFDISIWHPTWVIFITVPIYYIFFGEKDGGDTTIKDFKDEIKSKFKKKDDYDPNSCDYDSSK